MIIFKLLNNFWIGYICGGLTTAFFLLGAFQLADRVTKKWEYPISKEEWRKIYPNDRGKNRR